MHKWDFEKIKRNREKSKPIPVVRFHETEETMRYKSLSHAARRNGLERGHHIKYYIEKGKKLNGYLFDYQ